MRFWIYFESCTGLANQLDMGCELKRRTGEDLDFWPKQLERWSCHQLKLRQLERLGFKGRIRNLVLDILNWTYQLNTHIKMLIDNSVCISSPLGQSMLGDINVENISIKMFFKVLQLDEISTWVNVHRQEKRVKD